MLSQLDASRVDLAVVEAIDRGAAHASRVHRKLVSGGLYPARLWVPSSLVYIRPSLEQWVVNASLLRDHGVHEHPQRGVGFYFAPSKSTNLAEVSDLLGLQAGVSGPRGLAVSSTCSRQGIHQPVTYRAATIEGHYHRWATANFLRGKRRRSTSQL